MLMIYVPQKKAYCNYLILGAEDLLAIDSLLVSHPFAFSLLAHDFVSLNRKLDCDPASFVCSGTAVQKKKAMAIVKQIQVRLHFTHIESCICCEGHEFDVKNLNSFGVL